MSGSISLMSHWRMCWWVLEWQDAHTYTIYTHVQTHPPGYNYDIAMAYIITFCLCVVCDWDRTLVLTVWPAFCASDLRWWTFVAENEIYDIIKIIKYFISREYCEAGKQRNEKMFYTNPCYLNPCYQKWYCFHDGNHRLKK